MIHISTNERQMIFQSAITICAATIGFVSSAWIERRRERRKNMEKRFYEFYSAFVSLAATSMLDTHRFLEIPGNARTPFMQLLTENLPLANEYEQSEIFKLLTLFPDLVTYTQTQDEIARQKVIAEIDETFTKVACEIGQMYLRLGRQLGLPVQHLPAFQFDPMRRKRLIDQLSRK